MINISQYLWILIVLALVRRIEILTNHQNNRINNRHEITF